MRTVGIDGGLYGGPSSIIRAASTLGDLTVSSFLRRHRFVGLVAGVAVALVGGGLAVTVSGSANAIANGEVVPDGRYRFAAKLTMTGIPTASGGRRNSACSGALIAPQWIVTAGHCFRDAGGVRVSRPVADVTTVTVGRANLTGTGGVEATVTAVRQSPVNDLAVAKLDRAVTGIEPLQLAAAAPSISTVVRLTGFGSTTSTNPVPSTQLLTGQFTVTAVNQNTLGVTGKAPAANTSACPFDSGAPYFTERDGEPATLVSVENTGPSCPHSGQETTARVDVLRDWITEQITAPPARLRLTSLCPDAGAEDRTWRVRNTTAGAVWYTWDVYGGEQRGSGSAPAGADTTFTTGADAATVRLFVDGELVDTKAACTV